MIPYPGLTSWGGREKQQRFIFYTAGCLRVPWSTKLRTKPRKISPLLSMAVPVVLATGEAEAGGLLVHRNSRLAWATW